ncbi:hypothetical protein BC937DRAFT_91758 [Endogone sp. FLAS-F59071]|nr:hypothetical protein BC937DRAFT_91758 [Endogone sp. FLAS-F59071]|eukprot:RUS21708.1 hypothetical protein BC937DRAFT_91758 [Endogone sp. FLAS-F59071]
MNINTLPVEIMDCILSHIPFPQPLLATLSLVQQDWYSFFSRRLYRKPIFPKHASLTLFARRLTPRHVPLLLDLDLSPNANDIDDVLLWQIASALTTATPQLTHLNLSCCMGITDQSAIPLFKSIGPTLTTVALSHCSYITNFSLTLLATHSPALETLILSSTSLFDPHSLVPLGFHTRCLRSIDLADCPWVTDATLLRDLRPLSSLRALRVSRCISVTPAAICGFVADHPWLEEIEIEGMVEMTDAQIAKMSGWRPSEPWRRWGGWWKRWI